MAALIRPHWRRRVAWLTWASLLLALTGCAGVSPPPQAPSRLAAYPTSPALLSIKATHAEAATDRDQRALLMTWFVDGDPNVAEFCSVLPDGHVSAYRLFYDSANQPRPKRDLDSEELSQLKQTMDSLPPSQSPALSHLLIVSFRNYTTGEWVTRTYDRSNRPAAVSTLFAVTGAPIEPE